MKKMKHRHLVIDVGNTRAKIGVFVDDQLVYNEQVSDNPFDEILKVIKEYNCQKAIFSSVGKSKKNMLNRLSSHIQMVEMSYSLQLPYQNCYQTPHTLGVDRMALVAGAFTSFPNNNVLIIDAGTCITYDFINSKNQYMGGSISPGINMRYQSLQYFTEKLPLLSIKEEQNFVGATTEHSIHSGVVFGVISEIDGIIDLYKQRNDNLTILLTGGNANFLAKRVKNAIFAEPFLLMKGLNKILIYNLQLIDDLYS